MQRTSPIRCRASILLLILSATILLLSSLTTPVIHRPHADWSLYTMVLMKPDQDVEHTVVRWGTFGSCHDTIGGEEICTRCTESSVGYDTCSAMYGGVWIKAPSDARCDTADDLSRGMVLHPIASATAFAAAFIAIAAESGWSLAGSVLASLAWIFTVIVVGIDVVVFKIIEERSNTLGEYADFTVLGRHSGPIMYCLMGGLIALTMGTPLMLWTAFVMRKEEKRNAALAAFHRLRSTDSIDAADEKDDDTHRP